MDLDARAAEAEQMWIGIVRFGMVAVICAVLAAGCASSVYAQSSSGQPTAQAVEPVIIDGYRSARFGTGEAEVKRAIKADLGGDDPARVVNEIERTTALVMPHQALLPDSPPATVSYILGATSAKLVQVNIVWGDNGGADIRQIVLTANALVQYFIQKGSYAKDSLVVNQKLPDGTILAFRGADAQGRMVLLQLVPIADASDAKKPEGKDKLVDVNKGMLKLSYIENPAKPDIFRIEKGRF